MRRKLTDVEAAKRERLVMVTRNQISAELEDLVESRVIDRVDEEIVKLQRKLETDASRQKLHEDENLVLNYLAAAWNAFARLPEGHPDNNLEFRQSIHRCQYIIGTRVAARVNPEIWVNHGKDNG